MSLPPEIIQVKRLKRKARDDDHNDEGVVDYLRLYPPYPSLHLCIKNKRLTFLKVLMVIGSDTAATHLSTSAALNTHSPLRTMLVATCHVMSSL